MNQQHNQDSVDNIIDTLREGDHIHIMGICGTAMGSLAGLLKTSGFKVTGSDQNVYPPISTQLHNLGIAIKEGYKRENLTPKPKLVIVGNVISRTNEEADELLKSDIPYTSFPKAMNAFLLKKTRNIVVAGTHGKTTTTSMMAWVADQCGFKPGFLIGGVAKNFNKTFQLPGDVTSGPSYFVIEGDEYDTAFFDKVPKFIYYRPFGVILGTIEFDHADIYADLAAVKKAFVMLTERVAPEGVIVARAGDPNVAEVLTAARCSQVITFGWNSGDYQVGEWNPEQGSFTIRHQGMATARVNLQVIGQYNVLNALGCFAMTQELGWNPSEVIKALESFSGVKRRQEILGKPHGITVIEDFAHHPTAVRLTIEAVRERYPRQKIFALFEPRSATSRRRIFEADFAQALSGADVAVLAAPYDQSRIAIEDRFSSDRVVEFVRGQGRKAQLCSDNGSIVTFLKEQAKAPDIILIMSNGGFGGLYDQLLKDL